MESDDTAAVKALSALGHEVRLHIFRLLIRAGDPGLNVGEIGAHLGVPPSTLAHHLTALVSAGLVIQERKGRSIRNRVDYTQMNWLLAYLSSECCDGVLPVIDENVA